MDRNVGMPMKPSSSRMKGPLAAGQSHMTELLETLTASVWGVLVRRAMGAKLSEERVYLKHRVTYRKTEYTVCKDLQPT